ncbi:MAG: hypothetical protein ACT4OP_11730 [Actinomycetota bacterium]
MRLATRATVVTAVTLLLLSLLVALELPAKASPPIDGSGVVKVDGFDLDTYPGNQPHAGCVFQVEFYGYGPGAVATVLFELQPPTGPVAPILFDSIGIGGDEGGGGADFDGAEAYNLSAVIVGYEQHPQQGWQLKLTVNASGSNGDDGKSTVFWITSCTSSQPATASAEVSSGCIEGKFVISHTSFGAVIDFTVDAVGIQIDSGRPVVVGPGTVLNWSAAAIPPAVFPASATTAGSVTVASCEVKPADGGSPPPPPAGETRVSGIQATAPPPVARLSAPNRIAQVSQSELPITGLSSSSLVVAAFIFAVTGLLCLLAAGSSDRTVSRYVRGGR